MFAILPWNFDIVDQNQRLFDIILEYSEVTPFMNPISFRNIHLEKCTIEHFNFSQ